MSSIRIILFIILLNWVSAIQKSKFSVWSPPNLILELGENRDLKMSIGNFGYVPWGRSIMGHLYTAQPLDACEPIKPIEFLPDEATPIIIVRRGQCSFVTKTFYVQLAGAKLALIVDDRDEDVYFEEMISDDSTSEHPLHIPAVLIPKTIGEKIFPHVLDFMNTGNNAVSISMYFKRPQHAIVESEIWMSVSDKRSYQFLNSISPYIVKIEEVANLRPHFVIWDCEQCKEIHYSEPNPDCLGGGRYCAVDPDGTGPLTGRDALMEILTQICLYETDSFQYYEYTKPYISNCLSKGKMGVCGILNYMPPPFELNRVNECIQRSFEGGPDIKQELQENNILRGERERFLQRQVSTWPSIVINKNKYKGPLTPLAVFTGICEKIGSPPAPCMPMLNSTYVIQQEVADFQPEISFISFSTYVVAGCLLFMSVFFFLYRRYLKRRLAIELNDQIHRNVENYFRIKESNGQSP